MERPDRCLPRTLSGRHRRTRAESDLIETARGCIDVLRERALETERSRRALDSNIQLLGEAGLFRILKPRIYGGYQYPVSTFTAAMAELGKGCSSTAWVAMIYNGIMWVSSLFPERCQQELHENSEVRVAGQFGPVGEARRVDGGITVNGRFAFGSGCLHADWLLAGSPLLSDSGEMADHLLFLVPVKEVEILDDWHTSAMSGTGSNSYVIKDVFVPEHRTLSATAALEGRYACTHLAAENLYRSAFVPMAAWLLMGPILGMTEAAVDELRKRVKGKRISYTFYEDQSQATVTHIQLGEAAMQLEAAKCLADEAAREIYAWAEQPQYMERAARARLRATAGFAAQLCRQAVDTMHGAGGGGVIHEANPIQRIARDIQAVTNHGMIYPASVYEMYGRLLFDLPPVTPAI